MRHLRKNLHFPLFPHVSPRAWWWWVSRKVLLFLRGCCWISTGCGLGPQDLCSQAFWFGSGQIIHSRGGSRGGRWWDLYGGFHVSSGVGGMGNQDNKEEVG